MKVNSFMFSIFARQVEVEYMYVYKNIKLFKFQVCVVKKTANFSGPCDPTVYHKIVSSLTFNSHLRQEESILLSSNRDVESFLKSSFNQSLIKPESFYVIISQVGKIKTKAT